MQHDIKQPDANAEKGSNNPANGIVLPSKDIVNSKKRRRRRLKGGLPQMPEPLNAVSPVVDAESGVNGCVEGEENDLDEHTHEVEELQENLEPNLETEEELYHENVEERQTQLLGMINRTYIPNEVGSSSSLHLLTFSFLSFSNAQAQLQFAFLMSDMSRSSFSFYYIFCILFPLHSQKCNLRKAFIRTI